MLLKVKGDPLNGQPVKGFGTREPELYSEFIKNHQVQGEFRNCHKGERCFIIGNGPTITDHDLSLLADEVVFTVNFASKLEQFKDMKSNYHVFMDLGGFETTGNNKLDNEFLEGIKNINSGEKSPKCFFNYYAYDYVKKNKLDDQLDVFYMFNFNSDFDGIKGSYWNVVLHSTALAIYMGFSEIYLLGCEWTNIIDVLTNKYNKNIGSDIDIKLTSYSQHGYKHSIEEESRLSNVVSSKELTSMKIVEIYKMCFEDIAYLRDLQEERGGKLINCTPKTIIDCLSRMKFEDVLAGK